MAKEFLSVNELSERLNIKKSTLYAMAKAGEIPHFRVNRLIRFREREVDEWMECHHVKDIAGKGKTKRTEKSFSKSKMDIDRIIKNAIDESKGLKYNPDLGSRVESSTQKGGDHGLV